MIFRKSWGVYSCQAVWLCYRGDPDSSVPHLGPSPGSPHSLLSSARPLGSLLSPSRVPPRQAEPPLLLTHGDAGNLQVFVEKARVVHLGLRDQRARSRPGPGPPSRAAVQPRAAARPRAPLPEPLSHLLLGGVSHPAEPAGRRVPLQRRAGHTVMDVIGAQHPLHLRGARVSPAALPRAAPAASPGPRRATRRRQPPSLRRPPPWPSRAAPPQRDGTSAAGRAEGFESSFAFHLFKWAARGWAVTINQLHCEHGMLG